MIINMLTRPHFVDTLIFLNAFSIRSVSRLVRYYQQILEVCKIFFFLISDRLLLHELVAIQTENWKILTRRYRSRIMYSRDICLRVVEKRAFIVVWIKRRKQRRKDWVIRQDKEFEKSQSQVKNSVGSR